MASGRPGLPAGYWSPPRTRTLPPPATPAAAPPAQTPTPGEGGVSRARGARTSLFASARRDAGQRAGALDLATDLGFSPVPLPPAAAFLTATELDCRQYHSHFT